MRWLKVRQTWLYVLILVCSLGLVYHVLNSMDSIRKALPVDILQQHSDVAALMQEINELAELTDEAVRTRQQQDLTQLLAANKITQNNLARIRESYNFDNLVGIARFHALIQPALTDISQWITEGVHHFKPDSIEVLTIVRRRAFDLRQDVQNLFLDTYSNLRFELDREAQQLDELYRSVWVLLIVFTLTSLILILSIVRQSKAAGELAAINRKMDSTVKRRTRELEVQIRERTKAENNVRLNEKRFRDFAESASDWFWETDADLRFTYIGQQYFTISGVDSNDVIGKSRLEFIGEDISINNPMWQQHLDDMLNHRPFTDLEYRSPSPKGDAIYIQISGVPVFDEFGLFQGYRGAGRNITKRVLEENALQAANEELEAQVEQRTREFIAAKERFEKSFHHSPSMISIADIDTAEQIDVNDRFLEKMGYSKDEVMGKTAFDLGSWRHAETRSELIKRLRAEGAVKDIEVQLKTKKDRTLDCLLSAEIVNFGDTERVMWFFDDISEQKHTRESLLRETQFSNTLIDSLPGIFYVFDQNGKLYRWNKAFETASGYNAVEIAHMHPKDFFPKEKHQDIEKLIDKTFLKGMTEGELRLQSKDKSSRPFFLTGRRIVMNDQSLLVGVGIDLSDREMAEVEIKRLRNYLGNIINSMPSILIGVDREACVTHWNHEAEKATGVKSNAALGRFIGSAMPMLGHLVDAIRQAVLDRNTMHRSSIQFNLEPNPAYHDITVYPLRADGIDGAVIRIDDVTARVRLEEAVVQSKKMLSVGGLAAGMAHEINNPLAGILQNVQVMKNRMAENTKKNRQVAEQCGAPFPAVKLYLEKRDLLRMADTILESGKRATRIVNNMLSFSRKNAIQRGKHDLAELIDRTLELASNDYDLKKKYDFRKIDIHKNYDSDVPEVTCDSTALQQVLLNLLKNGAQAMTKNPQRQDPRFNIRLFRADGFVKIQVEDNGSGIPPNVKKRIFEPFFTTKKVGEGTGLGLTVSYFIITENHQGTLEVESEPGAGSKFIIGLPLEHRDGHPPH